MIWKIEHVRNWTTGNAEEMKTALKPFLNARKDAISMKAAKLNINKKHDPHSTM